MPVSGKGSSYYARNKSRLQIYQRDYNAFKRVGRRKMSADDRAAFINKRRREMEGDRSTYTNTIVRRDTTNDPEQTDYMRSTEQNAWMSASYLLIDLWRVHGEDNWDECTPPYLDSIHSLLEDELTAANIVLKSSNPSNDTLHLHRRVIAFYHQEIELRSQGQDAWNSAIEDDALVMYGRGVNKTTFKRLYGF